MTETMEITTRDWLKIRLPRYLYRKALRNAYYNDPRGMLDNLAHKRISFPLALSALFELTEPNWEPSERFWLKLYMDGGVMVEHTRKYHWTIEGIPVTVAAYPIHFTDRKYITWWDIMGWISKHFGRGKPKFKETL